MNKLSKLTALLLALMLFLAAPLAAVAEATAIETESEYLTVADQILQKMIMAYDNYGDYKSMAELIAEEDFVAFYEGLSEADQIAMANYITQKFWDSCIAYTNVGPFLPPIEVVSQARSSLSATSRADGEEEENGLILKKTVTPGGKAGEYVVRLESYVTGTVKVEQVEVCNPADIVLVLDTSGSMKWDFAGNEKFVDEEDMRRYALQLAVENFINTVRDKYDAANGVDHRIAIVDYDSQTNTRNCIGLTHVTGAGYDALINKVPADNAFSGGTQPGAGLQTAYDYLYTSYSYDGKSTKPRSKVVVLFTDGLPGQSGFDPGSAVAAITRAKALKDQGITVYSVAIVDDADPTNEVDWTVSNSDNTKAQIADTFLHAVSSNYPSATARTANNGRTLSVTARTGGNNGYYLTADNKDSLNTIFQGIADNIQSGSSSMQLGSTTVVKDIVAPSFSMPANASNVIAWTEECSSYTASTGAATFTAETHTTTESGLTVTTDTTNNAIDVTGFDFAANFVSEKGYKEDDPNAEGNYHGKRLVIQFTVAAKEGFLGGSAVPTNGDASGVYSNGEIVEPFTVPTVDFSVKEPTVAVVDKNVYLLDTLTQEELINGAAVTVYDVYGNAIPLDLSSTATNYGLAAWQTEYVDLSVVKPDAIGATLTADAEFELSCTLAPKNTTGTPVVAKATINVFTPELTFEDSEVTYGELLTDPTYFADTNYVKTEWKHGDTLDTAVTMIGAKPTLALDYDYLAADLAETGTTGVVKVVATQDIPVEVTVKIDDTDVTAFTNFMHADCDFNGCQWVTTTHNGNPAFFLHLGFTTMTITKNGMQENESAIFTVSVTTSKGPQTIMVAIPNDGTVTIGDLVVGSDYTISESGTWTWKYTPKDMPKTGKIAADPASNCVTIENTGSDKWLNDEAYVHNDFSQNKE